MVQMVVGRGMSVEQVVWQLNFSQGAKSPVISPVGQLPDEVTLGLIQRAKEDDVVAMMAPRKQMAPQLAAPQSAPALAYQAPAPVQTAPVYAAPVQVPVQAAPVYAAPVQAAPVYTAPVQAAPVYAAPVQAAPVYTAPVQAAPVYAAPVQAPVQAAPVSMPQQSIPATNVPSQATRAAALSAFSGLLAPQGAA
jgi:ribonuclease E